MADAGRKLTDAQIAAIPGQTKRALKAQAQYEIMIPPSPDKEENKIRISVTINGYNFKIRRGEKVVVPKAVVSVLKRAGYFIQEREIARPKKVNPVTRRGKKAAEGEG